MLVASVARHHLLSNATARWTSREGQEVLNRLDRVFGDWDPYFPEFADLVSTAVWADHIKCRRPSEICERSYGIQLFNEEHFVDVFYNRTMTPAQRLENLNAALAKRDNAYYLLKTIDTSLTASSVFTANLLIRLFIHVFGDIHQPLHTLDYRGDCLPQGDRGGNVIIVHGDGRGGVNPELHRAAAARRMDPSRLGEASTLHGLWDSGGWAYGRSYPTFTVTEAEQLGSQIALRHPYQTFRTFSEVVKDSYELASEVYGPILPAICADHHVIPDHFTLTPEYLALVRKRSEERIAAAGFSLSVYLHKFASRIELPPSNPATTGHSHRVRDNSNKSNHLQFWQIYSVCVTAAFLIVVILMRIPSVEHRSPAPSLVPSRLEPSAVSRKRVRDNIESLSCGTSDNLNEKLINYLDLEDPSTGAVPGTGDIGHSARVIVSNSHFSLSARS